MKIKIRLLMMLLLTMFACTQTAFGDIVVQKDAIGPAAYGVLAFNTLLLIAAAVAAVWVISIMVIKAVRNKNAGK